MIRSYTLSTLEVDDVDASVAEIMGQLNGKELGKHTVGIIACHYEFVTSGVVETLAKALPFKLVGTISAAQAVNNSRGSIILTILVLTSDDVEFVTHLSDSLIGNPQKAVEAAYDAASAGHAGKPAMAFLFAAFLPENDGDMYVDTLTTRSGVPVFGTVSVDDTNDFSNALAIYDGASYRERLALILFYGDVKPAFHLATISRNRVLMDRPALITKSSRNILIDVNGRPVLQFFDEMGLTKSAESQYAMTSIPFMVDYNDGYPMGSKVFIALTPDKQAIFAGNMPEGATMYMGVFDKGDLVKTTTEAIEDCAKALDGKQTALIYSCLSRYMNAGIGSFLEFDIVEKTIGEKANFMIAISGGEVCPTHADDEHAANRLHNNAFIVCAF